MKLKVLVAAAMLLCLSIFSVGAQCTPQALPYTENFDNLSALSSCFITHNAVLSTASYYSSPKSVKLTTSTASGAYIVFPAVQANANALECYFKIRGGSNTVNFYAGIVTDTSDIEGSFMPIYSGSVQGTTWQDVEFNTSSYSAATSPTFVCIYMMDGASADVYVDNMDIHALPTCVRPSGITVTNAGMNDVTFGWTAGGSETQWSVTYQIMQNGATVASSTVTSTQPSYTVTGLSSSTAYTYTLSVRSLCGATDSSIARTASGSFSTSCQIVSTFPYTENFESGILPNTCENIFNPYNQQWSTISDLVISSAQVHSGSYSMKATDGNVGNMPSLALPQMNFTDPSGYTVKFWVYRDNYSPASYPNEGFQVSVSPVNNSLTSATVLGFIPRGYSVAPSEATTGWYQYSFDIPTTFSGLYYVIITYTNQYGTFAYCDDITVEVSTGCRGITATAENITSTTADIVASDPTATAWQIYYGVNSSSATGTTVTATTSRYTLTGLTSNTQYGYYVRRICGTDTSDWSTIQLFRTLEVADTLPFTTGFENSADDSRWTMTTQGYSNFTIGSDANAVYAGSRALYVSTNGSTYGYSGAGQSQGYASRLFYFEDKEYTISFRYKCTGGEISSDGISIYDFGRIFLVPGNTTLTGGTQWMTYASYDGNWPDGMIPIEPSTHAYYSRETGGDANGWHYMSYDINMVGQSGNYKFALMWNNDYSTANPYPLAIDDLSITEITCSRPNPVVSNLTSSSATLGLNGAASYRIVVSSQPIADAQNPTGDIMDTTITGNSLVINGLTANTTYYYTARGYCANNDTSDWRTPASFTTECLSNVPYAESFEQASVLDCWSYAGDNALTRSNTRAHQGLRSLYIDNVTAISPELDVDSMTNYTLTGWVYTETADQLQIGAIVDPTDGSTIVSDLDTFNIPANRWTEFTATFTLLNDPDYADYKNARHFTLTMANGTAFNADQLYFSIPTVCSRPTNPVITDTVHNGFQMTWTDSVANQWVVRVADTLGTVYTYVVDSQYVNVNNLEEQTTYSVEVAAICGVGDTSLYTSCGVVHTPVYVPTCADPAAAPTVNATTATTMTVTANGNYIWYEFAYSTNANAKTHGSASLQGVASNRVVLTGLSANTTYYVWFRGVCVVGDTSRWSAVASGTTTYNDFFMPQNPHVVGVAEATSTTIAWGGCPDADKYEYELVNDTTGEVTTDTVLFTHLTAATTYTFRVRGIQNSPADTTAWSTLTFKTLAPAAVTPYFCDFETVSENNCWMFENGNQTNHFMIGTSYDFDQTATQALFVTGNDSNAVYQNVASTVYAMRALNLSAGTYKYSYNWVCAGEPGWNAGTAYDYPRIFLAPATMQFTAGTVADGIGYGFSDIPTGCWAMDSGYHLTQALSTRYINGQLEITEAGLYNMVIFWTNDDRTMYDPAITVDSIRIAQLIEGPTYTDTICYGESYTDHGFNVPFSQLYVGVNNLQRIAGGAVGAPDTVIRATVTMRAQIVRYIYDTICQGENYNQYGYSLVTPGSGQYPHTGDISYTGCDSSTYLYLTVIPTSSVSYENLCKGDTYTWHGQTITTGGTYTYSGEGARGCTVSDTLIVSVLDGDSTYSVQICSGDTYYFVDTVITTAGTYTRRFYDSTIGCTVTYTVTVTEVSSKSVDYYDNVCEGYPYSGYGISGLVITQDTVVTTTVKSQHNCDSTTNVYLHFIATVTSEFDDTIPASGVYYFGTQTLTEAGDYTETFKSAEGCDSVVTLHLHESGTGVESVVDVRVDIVPNPVNAGMTAMVYCSASVEMVEVVNQFGQMVDRFEPVGYPIEVRGITASGIYYVRLISTDGKVYMQKLVVK